MLTRCYIPASPDYKNYGGRGIEVCARWQNSFDAFVSDMGPKPTPEHSIERKNNDGNYDPNNCKWATSKEQQQNRRRRG